MYVLTQSRVIGKKSYVNKLHEEAKLKQILLKQISNEILGDLRNKLKTTIENQFKKSYPEIILT